MPPPPQAAIRLLSDRLPSRPPRRETVPNADWVAVPSREARGTFVTLDTECYLLFVSAVISLICGSVAK